MNKKTMPKYPEPTVAFKPGRRPRGKIGTIKQTMPRFFRDETLLYKGEERRLRHWSWKSTSSERAVQEALDLMPSQLVDNVRVSKSGNDLISYGKMVMEALREKADAELIKKELHYLHALRLLHERQIGRVNKRVRALGGLIKQPVLTRAQEIEETRHRMEIEDEVGKRRVEKRTVGA